MRGSWRMTLFFFFNDTATTEIYTLSLHDALPIWRKPPAAALRGLTNVLSPFAACARSEEHTSELQSRQYLVCRLLLEKKKKPPRHPPPGGRQNIRLQPPHRQRPRLGDLESINCTH